jgi:cytochrome c oxidase subunit 2
MLANLIMRIRKLRTRDFFMAFSVLALWDRSASAEWGGLNMPVGVTPVSREVYDLHMLILWVCVVIGIVVFGAMFYSIYHHRKSRGAVAAQFHESTTLELAWTLVPFLILVVMAIPATRVLIAMEDTSQSAMTIKVTGYQWKWKYDYINEDISFFSTLSTPREQLYGLAEKDEHYLLEVDNHLVLPINTKIRILTTAADVIHAWWVPNLGWKRDAIPGYINDNWTYIEKEGTYRGQCAELCGKDHGFMPIVVDAVSKEKYQEWVSQMKGEQTANATAGAADRQWSREELMAEGEKVYNTTCVACHQANGQGIPGNFPAINSSAVATGTVEGHAGIVMHGKPGTAMVAFASQLSDAEIASVLTFQRNAWDNKVGDLVQPSAIKALR